MTFPYINRKKQSWYLFEGLTRLGKPRYFVSQSEAAEAGKPLSSVPDGYEIYEKPNGQVFCRKRQPVLIFDEEVEVVKKELAKHRLADCIVERKGKDLIVHESEGSEKGSAEKLASIMGVDPQRVAEFMNKTRHYQPVLLFQLTNEARRLFSASRWCFLGGIDGWSPLDSERPLADLAKKYVKHIGKESFYELM